MAEEVNITTQTIRLLSVLAREPNDEWYGLQIASEAQLKSGTVYLILARLEDAGWLTSRWETIDPSAEGRPRRRLYTLTAGGHAAAVEALYGQADAIGAPRPKLKPRRARREAPA